MGKNTTEAATPERKTSERRMSAASICRRGKNPTASHALMIRCSKCTAISSAAERKRSLIRRRCPCGGKKEFVFWQL
jgi:hypothetical protein